MTRSPEIGRGQVESEVGRTTGGAVLRLVSSSDEDSGGPGSQVPEAPDLRVDREAASLMLRSRWCAVVRAYHAPGTSVALHAGFREMLQECLDGREPATGFAPDFVEVNFHVLNDGPQSRAAAEAVGSYLSAVVDPLLQRPAEIEFKFVDTSDLDPFLPEHLRTLK